MPTGVTSLTGAGAMLGEEGFSGVEMLAELSDGSLSGQGACSLSRKIEAASGVLPCVIIPCIGLPKTVCHRLY